MGKKEKKTASKKKAKKQQNKSKIVENRDKKKKKKDISSKVKKLEKKVEKIKNDLKEETEKKLRILADFKNYKKRIEKEREELNLLANATILNLILEILDDLNRAVKEIEEPPVGLSMIESKITNLLDQQGIEETKVKEGDKFDPKVMEAIGTVTVPKEKENNKIIHIERKGYKFKDKDIMVRQARVIVGKFEKNKKS